MRQNNILRFCWTPYPATSFSHRPGSGARVYWRRKKTSQHIPEKIRPRGIFRTLEKRGYSELKAPVPGEKLLPRPCPWAKVTKFRRLEKYLTDILERYLVTSFSPGLALGRRVLADQQATSASSQRPRWFKVLPAEKYAKYRYMYMLLVHCSR